MDNIIPIPDIEGIVTTEEPLKEHTTFRLGGAAAFFAEPADEKDLRKIVRWIGKYGMSFKIIGGGSNILAGTQKLPDAVISLRNFNRLDIDGRYIRAGAGTGLAALSGAAAENGLSGLEFLAGIPGQAGGAVKTNAGAWGKCTADAIKEITVMNPGGEISVIQREDISFGYRFSSIGSNTIITEVIFRTYPSNTEYVNKHLKDILTKRKKVFPSMPSAGCVFKNLKEESAGRIIDRLGLKGFTIGKAMVSRKHANIIINLGDASSADTYSLINYVKEDVYKKTGYKLDLEIECWGMP